MTQGKLTPVHTIPAFIKYPEFLEFLNETATNRTNSRNTIVAYQTGLMHLGEYLIERKIETVLTVTQQDIIGYHRWLVAHGYRSTTMACWMAAMRQLYGYLLYENRIEQTPVPPRMPKLGKSSRVPMLLTPEVIFRAREKRFVPVHIAAFFELMLSSGMRLMELIQLRANQLEFDARPTEYAGGRIQILKHRTQVKREKNRITYFSPLAARLLHLHFKKEQIDPDSNMPVFAWRAEMFKDWIRELFEGVAGAEEIIKLMVDESTFDFADVSLGKVESKGMRQEIAAQHKRAKEFEARRGVVDPLQKKIRDQPETQKGFTARTLRRCFACLMWYRNYHGERNNETRLRRMLGHTDISTTYQYLFELDWVANDTVWETLVLGKKRDWFATT